MVRKTLHFLLLAAASFAGNVSSFHLPEIPRPTTALLSTSNFENDHEPGRRLFLNTAMATLASLTIFPDRNNAFDVGGKIQFGDESIMTQKEHGTSAKPVQEELLYDVSNKLADKICNYNRYG